MYDESNIPQKKGLPSKFTEHHFFYIFIEKIRFCVSNNTLINSGFGNECL